MALLNKVRVTAVRLFFIASAGCALGLLLILIFRPAAQTLPAQDPDIRPARNQNLPALLKLAAVVPRELVQAPVESLAALEKEEGPRAGRRGYRNSSSVLTSILMGRSRAVCVGSDPQRGEVEDLLCLPKPNYDKRMKNPCWWEDTPMEARGNATNGTGGGGGAHPPTPAATIRSLSCLPYFHILCCSKSGTTDMYRRISMHPELVPNFGMFGKERLWWGWAKYGYVGRRTKSTPTPFHKYIKGFGILARYLEKATDKGDDKALQKLITLDGSPPDMWDLRGWNLLPQNRNLRQPAVTTPHIMRHLYRDPRFLILVRDPVERLYTAYLFHGLGHSAAKFHEDVVEGIAMFDSCLATAQDRIECFVNASAINPMPVDLYYSCYAVYFEEWFKVFPKKHFLFIRTEDYSKNLKNSLLSIFKFLDMPKPSNKDMMKMLGAPISYHTHQKDVAGAMLNETRALLRNWYKPWNHELAYLMKDKGYLWDI